LARSEEGCPAVVARAALEHQDGLQIPNRMEELKLMYVVEDLAHAEPDLLVFVGRTQALNLGHEDRVTH
jgi:Tfp pilus assembly ATPase PilU